MECAKLVYPEVHIDRLLGSCPMAFHRIDAHKQNNCAIENLNPLDSPIDHGMKGIELTQWP